MYRPLRDLLASLLRRVEAPEAGDARERAETPPDPAPPPALPDSAAERRARRLAEAMEKDAAAKYVKRGPA